MNQKAKAKQLVDKFYKCMSFKDTKLTSCEEKPSLIIEMEKLSAKQCAIIAVNDIIDALEVTIGNSAHLDIEYWNSVITEIKKL